MIQQYWGKLSGKIDDLSLRERVLIFAACAFILVSLINVLFLNPLLAKEKRLSGQVQQQQERIKSIQAQIEALVQAKHANASSPLRQRMAHLKQQLAEGDNYMRNKSDRLVPSEKMADVLKQMLNRNGRLQLVSLETLPVAPLAEKNASKKGGGNSAQPSMPPGREVFEHGVRITVRGSYRDMLKYLEALEHLPAQMFWGAAKLDVTQYPSADLTLTVYTLSLNKKWLVV